MSTERIAVVTGGAGLVGQNLVHRLTKRGYKRVVAIDKHRANTEILARLNPGVQVIEADLARAGSWGGAFADADTLILNHAQIGALEEELHRLGNIRRSKPANEEVWSKHVPRPADWEALSGPG